MVPLLTAIAAVAVAGLTPRLHRWGEPAVALGCSLLLVSTALMKWTTVGTMAAAAAVVAALCWPLRTRLVWVAVASTVLLPLSLGAQVLLVPHEGLWLHEVQQLNPDPTAGDWCDVRSAPTSACGLQSLVADQSVIVPALLMLPAALVLLAGTTTGRLRWAALVLPLVAVTGTVATTVVQAQWFGYHFALIPVVAAGWLGWALCRGARCATSSATALVTLAAGAGSIWLLTRPLDVRESTRPFLLGETPATIAFRLAAGFAVVGIVAALLDLRRGSRSGGAPDPRARPRWISGPVAALAVLATTLSPVLPTTAYSFNFQPDHRTAQGERERAASSAALGGRIRAAIGPETPVVYLSFGERAYWVANPSPCRYAAATFLQRSRYVDTTGLTSFAENLHCLSDQRAAYVVIEDSWLGLPKGAPVVRRRLDEHFDCEHPVLAEENATVCPRRAGR